MKRLYRSRTNRIIAGVCGGLGEYFQIDPLIIRLIWLILFLAGGVGLLVYLIAWIIIPTEFTSPDEKTSRSSTPPQVRARTGVQVIVGILLIFLGVTLFMREWWYFDHIVRDVIRIFWRYFLPAVLIIGGLYILVKGNNRQ